MQAHIVRWFSETYPHYHGSLFKVNNESRNPMFQLATGLIPGASDLVLFAEGRFAGIELKLKGKLHNKDHLETQRSWGRYIESQGGTYLMSDDVDEIKIFITRLMQPIEKE